MSTNTGSSEGSSKKTSSGHDSSGAGGGTTEARACAACKYQRRRCAPDCPLAQYFPAEKLQQFLNVHKLFGLKKLFKVLKDMKPPQRDIAVKSMIFQARVRASDPVGGCYRIMLELQKQIDLYTVELNFVLQQLAVCRAQVLGKKTQNPNTNNLTENTTAAEGKENGDSTAAEARGEEEGKENGDSSIDGGLSIYNSIQDNYNSHRDAFHDILHQSEQVKPFVVDVSKAGL